MRRLPARHINDILNKMNIDDTQLKTFLLDSGLIKPEALYSAETESKKNGKSLHTVLIAQGAIQENEINRLEAYILGIPFVDISRTTIDPDVLRIIPEPIARKHNIVAFRKTGNDLEVAMLDPDDLPTIEFIKKK